MLDDSADQTMLGDSAYDAVVYEATPDKQVAWKLGVRSSLLDGPSSTPDASSGSSSDGDDDAAVAALESAYVHVGDGGAPLGWAMFSVERFFETPFVTGVAAHYVEAAPGAPASWGCTAEVGLRASRRTRLEMACRNKEWHP